MIRTELVRGLAADRYHEDPCDVPSLSQSAANTILQWSPLHAWQEHPRLGGVRARPTDGQRKGKIAHSMLLDRGPDVEIAVISHAVDGVQVDNYRTKRAQELRDAAIAEGKEPLLPREVEAFKKSTQLVAASFVAEGADLWAPDVEHEVSALWDDEGVQCRGRFDAVRIVPNGGGVDLWDVKAIARASRREVIRTISREGYDVQAAAYVRAIERIIPNPGRVSFTFCFYEPDPPFATHVVTLSPSFLALGARKWARARDVWRECLTSKHWPAYGRSVVSAPPWELAEEGIDE